MIRFKDLKMATKIISIVSISCILSSTIIFSLILSSVYTRNVSQAEDMAKETARYNAAKVQSNFEKVDTVLKATRGSLLEFRENKSLNREQIINLLNKELSEMPNVLAIYTLWEPNAFDGKDSQYINKPGHDETGRFIPYIVRSAKGIILQPLPDYTKEGAGNYYLLPKENGKTNLLEPLAYKVDGKDVLMTSITMPILDSSGKFVGMVGADIEISLLQTMIQKLKIMKGYSVLVSSSGAFVANGLDSSLIGKRISSQGEAWKSIEKGLSAGKEVQTYQPIPVTGESFFDFEPIHLDGSDDYWSFGTIIPKTTILSEYYSLLKISLVIIILTNCLLLLFLGIYVSRLMRPLVYVVDILASVAKGNLSVVIPEEYITKDEIGSLLLALKKTIESLKYTLKYSWKYK